MLMLFSSVYFGIKVSADNNNNSSVIDEETLKLNVGTQKTGDNINVDHYTYY